MHIENLHRPLAFTETDCPTERGGEKSSLSISDAFDVVVEIPSGGDPIKYEIDKTSGALVVDRFLYTPTRYPANYGFITRTLSLDGDPCDALVITPIPVMPGAIVRSRPIGVLLMEDERGIDEKIICVPVSRLTMHYDRICSLSDLPENQLAQMAHFFAHYKDLEPNKWVRIDRWGTAGEARKIIRDSLDREARAKNIAP